tara:strand:- start:260 stop:487 length:228 start_codon:yes stop_codon:yes gene_type:complete
MATPYELRFDMYNAALDRLKEAYWARKERVDVARETEGITIPQSDYPVFPTPAEVIAEAKVIMEFVNGEHQNQQI